MSRRLSIVAGAGTLPLLVAEAALASGDTVQIAALANIEAPAGATMFRASLAAPEAVVAAVREFGATHLVLAGALALDDAVRGRIAEMFGGTAASAGDAALSTLASRLEAMTGAKLTGVHEVIGDLLATAGHIAGPRATDAALTTAGLALRAAREVGRLDLGQAAVAVGNRIVAAEDVAGTDELIARVGRYRAAGLFGQTGSVIALGKASKPQQPSHIDLPAIGLRTVQNAAAAGVGIIAVEAGRALVLERSALVEAAEMQGISVVGLTIDG